MEKCRNCGKEYKDGALFGKDPELCTDCTLFKLEATEETLDRVKFALDSNVYWPEKRTINTRRKQLMLLKQ